MRAAIVLAAGRSRRFGCADKLLSRFGCRPLVECAVRTALAAPVGRVIVVARSRNGRVAGAVRAIGAHRCIVVSAQRGGRRRDSLAAGLGALRANEHEALVFLADMPFVSCATVRHMGRRKLGADAVRPVFRDRPGHPVLLSSPAAAFQNLQAGKPPFERKAVRAVPGDRGSVFDIDRPGDLLRFNRPVR